MAIDGEIFSQPLKAKGRDDDNNTVTTTASLSDDSIYSDHLDEEEVGAIWIWKSGPGLEKEDDEMWEKLRETSSVVP